LSAAGDPLERLAQVIDFEVFRADLEAALSRSDRAKGGRPPYDAVLMFKVWCCRPCTRCQTTRPNIS
jgi:IS5 family transposase